jgi:peptidyl-prolyl cis-trans isomerase A (cyclophilin A)
MIKWIAFVLLAGLTACSSSTTTENTTPATPAPAAEPATEPAATAAPPATEPSKTPEAVPANAADKPAPAADTKTAANNAVKKTGANLKPGLYAHFETSLGNFTAELNEKEAPITVANFMGLANGTLEWTDMRTGEKHKKPYYDGLIFHRVIDGFMVQGGDPSGTGMGGPGFNIKDEYNSLKHDKAGTLAMARTTLPDSAGSQFYITVAPQPGLDGGRPPYVVFGYVVEGVDVVLNIGHVPTGPGDKPLKPVVMKKIRVERVK